MNNSIDVLKKIYKPYRYTLLGKCTLLESTSGNIIIKEKGNVNISELFNYLKARNFNKFPKLIEDNRDDVNVYEYVSDVAFPKDQKMNDLIETIADLHNKTSYKKEVTDDKFKEIYENILANILYKENFYNELVNIAEDSIFPSPSSQILLINSSKIFSALDFSKRELEEWFRLVSEKKKQKVSLIHGNLKLEHYIRNENEYLISWDNSKIDTPILDLVKLYQNEGLNVDFSEKFEKYLSHYSLDDDELKLFFILIAIPLEVNLNNIEIDNVKQIRTVIDYVFKTEELIRPYYAKDKKE